MRSMLLIALVFCVVLLCVFTFLVPCCDAGYDFRIKTMFGFSLPPVVCRRSHVLFTLFVYSGVQHILCCVFCFVCLRLELCISNVASFSGLSILDYPFGFSNVYLDSLKFLVSKKHLLYCYIHI